MQTHQSTRVSPAKIGVVFNDKGGSGKTTSSCNLAGTLGLRGYDVLVADLDPSQTSANWLGTANGENFAGTIWPGFRYGSKVASELEKLSAKYEIIIVDCPPSVESASTWAALLVADIALIPTKTGPTDIAALPAAKKLVMKAQETAGRRIPAFVVPASIQMHRKDDQGAMLGILRDKEIPCFTAEVEVPDPNAPKGKTPKMIKKIIPLTLGARAAFTRSMLVGGTAHSIRNSNDAVEEIEALTSSFLKELGLPQYK